MQIKRKNFDAKIHSFMTHHVYYKFLISSLLFIIRGMHNYSIKNAKIFNISFLSSVQIYKIFKSSWYLNMLYEFNFK